MRPLDLPFVTSYQIAIAALYRAGDNAPSHSHVRIPLVVAAVPNVFSSLDNVWRPCSNPCISCRTRILFWRDAQLGFRHTQVLPLHNHKASFCTRPQRVKSPMNMMQSTTLDRVMNKTRFPFRPHYYPTLVIHRLENKVSASHSRDFTQRMTSY